MGDIRHGAWAKMIVLLLGLSGLVGCASGRRPITAYTVSPDPLIPPLATRSRSTATPLSAATVDPASSPVPSDMVATTVPSPVSPLGQNSYTTTLQAVDDNGLSRTVDVHYLLYLPGDYGQDPQYQWPLIIFLHGASERGDDPSVITRYSIPAFLTNTLAFPFIVLSPQSPSDDVWSNQTDVLDALLNQIQATYAVDPRRIYLTGQSMGGFGTWAMALKYPARFAAVVPVASGYDVTADEVPPNICDLKAVSIWVFHGALDEVIAPDQVTAMVQALQACGSNVRFTLYPDADHLGSSNRAYADPELYDWLLQQSLPDRQPTSLQGAPRSDSATLALARTPLPGDGALKPLGQHAYTFDLNVTAAKGLTRTATISYLLYLPGGYREDPDKQWPLVLFLHGSDERGNDPGELVANGLPKLLTTTLEFPAIVLSPQAPEDSVWWGAPLDEVSALLDHVQAKYAVDPKRVYLTGLSMGGFGAWALALREPQRFAALVPIAGGWDSERDTIPGNICDIKAVPIWVFHGAQDDIVLPKKSQLMVDALKKCGVEVRFTLYPDADHRESFERAYDDPELYAWMFDQHLP